MNTKNSGRGRFNKGQWQLKRERFHLQSHRPSSGVSDASPIGAVIAGLITKLGMENPIWLQALTDEWTDVVGKGVAMHTRPGELTGARGPRDMRHKAAGGAKGGILTVYVDSSVWLSELSRYGRDKILENIANRFGLDKVADVRFRLDPDKQG